MDLLRKKKKVVHLQTAETEFISARKGDIPLSLSLQDLLELLDEDEKAIVLLKFYQGYTFQEISEFINKLVSPVKSVLYGALEKLRKRTR